MTDVLATIRQQLHRSSEGSSLRLTLRRGDHWLWLTGCALAVAICMICGLLLLIISNGAGYFWPHDLVEAKWNGAPVMGIVTGHQPEKLAPDGSVKIQAQTQFRTGNRDIYGSDFSWYPTAELNDLTEPLDATAIERQEYGDFYGFPSALKKDSQVIAEGPQVWKALDEYLAPAQRLAGKIRSIRTHDIGEINHEMQNLQLKLKRLQKDHTPTAEQTSEMQSIQHELDAHQQAYQKLVTETDKLTAESARYVLVMKAVGGQEKDVRLADIVRIYRPNDMGFFAKVYHYLWGVQQFLFGEPRESNTEGGVAPAIFGTVMMTMLMSLIVTPFGVIAAVYLREYAKQGLIVRMVRISVNNLAGVPSIVFGVFGLGFFIYFIGGNIDQLFFSDALPTPTFGTGSILWASLTLALLTVPVVIVATEESIASVPRGAREGSLALGASKFQTLCRVVLPASIPGILTGVILAMARGAGEVAPLMITGVVKLAPELPLDGQFPFFHLDRKFMHLGFHIFDVGFQSPNVEAAKPMVYTTTLLLIGIIVVLNLMAIRLRDRIRRKYQTGAFA